jgi:hypothetical protein
VQRLRRVSDVGLSDFIDRGVGEPSYVGDLEVIQDRSSAQPTDHLRMGVNDGRALGPGWYAVEVVAGHDWHLRWSKGQAWFYLSAAEPVRRLRLRVSRGAIETDLHVVLGTQDLGSQPVVDHDMQLMTFELPLVQPASGLIEVRLGCATFRPSEVGGGEDQRDLGVRFAEAWLEA